MIIAELSRYYNDVVACACMILIRRKCDIECCYHSINAINLKKPQTANGVDTLYKGQQSLHGSCCKWKG